MLLVDFYESGMGETIVITFPDGGLGIVDAHPSTAAIRPGILDIVDGRVVHFVCLTHPHADHGRDLVPLVDSGLPIRSFWHTLSQVDQFFYGLGEVANYPGPHQNLVRGMQEKWAGFLIDLFFAVQNRAIPIHQLRDDQMPVSIAGVDVCVLSPDEDTQNRFTEENQKRLKDPAHEPPDQNMLSAILGLRYGRSLVLLGGDALRRNWARASFRHREHSLPKACVLKVPHHGASNAFTTKPSRHEENYLGLCHRQPPVKAVVFPGDTKHPDPTVLAHLRAKTELFVVGRQTATRSGNPLGLSIPGAVAVAPCSAGNPVVSFVIDGSGNVSILHGDAWEP